MFVLDVIADDFEELGMVYDEVGRLAIECGLTTSASEIKQGLLDLIGTGLARAYRVSPQGPLEELVGKPSSGEIDQFYFGVTETGRQLQASDYAGWPFDEAGSLKREWFPPER